MNCEKTLSYVQHDLNSHSILVISMSDSEDDEGGYSDEDDVGIDDDEDMEDIDEYGPDLYKDEDDRRRYICQAVDSEMISWLNIR